MHGVPFGQQGMLGVTGEENRLAIGYVLFEPGNDPTLIFQNVTEPDGNRFVVCSVKSWSRQISAALRESEIRLPRLAAASEEINTKWCTGGLGRLPGEGKGKEVIGLDNAVDLEREKGPPAQAPL